MARQPDTFRDFGILPDGLQRPPESVRSYFSRGRIIGQYVGTGFVSALGLGVALLFALGLPFPLNVVGCAAALAGFGVLVYLATHNDYRWVELVGQTLRAKRLYTGRVIERSINEIECLATMAYQLRRKETVVMEAVLGRVKGIEVRFRDRRTPLRILRADPAMANAKELIEAIIFRMGQLRPTDAEIVNHAGSPLVRYIRWKGEKPTAQRGNALVVVLVCFMLLAMIFGGILGFLGGSEQHRHTLASVPPQEMALQTLIDHGPGTNPHVALTDFRFGGYVVETKDKRWSSVTIALFPTGKVQRADGRAEPGQEIQAVLTCRTIRTKDDLARFVQQRRVTGLCPDAPGLTYGTVRTALIGANPGSHLSAAWDVEAISDAPNAAVALGLLLASGVCFTVIVVLALIAFKKA